MNRAAKLTFACFAGWLVVTLAYFAFYYDDLLSIFTPLLGGALLLSSVPLAATAAIIGIHTYSTPDGDLVFFCNLNDQVFRITYSGGAVSPP